MGISSFLLGPIFLVMGSIIIVFVLGLVFFSCTLFFYHSPHHKKRKLSDENGGMKQSSLSKQQKY